MSTGQINVQTENIFPIIKKFLYSDNEIFLRELISNAVDATQKLKALSSIGEFKGELGDLKIEVILDKDKKTLTVRDKGVGMTAEEVEKYINQIAFSGAEEFVQKYKDKADASIIGHFGLGFYSAFMVADKVEIFTKSHKEEPAVRWECDGSPEYAIEEIDKKERGTDIVLHIGEEGKEFLEEPRINTLLHKYCKFMPVSIKFGTHEETKKTGEGDDAKEEKVTVDNIINNTDPAWTKAPTSLTDEDYKNFYRELYPYNMDEPLFHIHLNVDYPFNLTGILFFPKLKNNLEVQKDKIQLYCNQVFVTDSVEGIVPDFLTLLHGVIDSPDIPLNVSRSYLQSDSNVKKISNHITKKVADKLEELYKDNKEDFEQKWDDIKIFIEYGMLSDEKFFERAQKFALYKNTDGEYATFEDYKAKVKPLQTDKDDKVIMLYASDVEAQHSYIEDAKAKGYEVLVMDTPLTAHLVNKLEQTDGEISFARVDGDTIDNLIKKDEEIPSRLSDEEKEKIKPLFEEVLDNAQFNVKVEDMSETDKPISITQPEFMRRMKDMNKVGGGQFGMSNMPDMYQVVVNANHPLISDILGRTAKKQQKMVKQAVDLALLSQNLLKGKELTEFINRSFELIK